MDISIQRVVGATAHGPAGLIEVATAERQRPVPDMHLLEILKRRQDQARILIERLLDLAGGNFERLLPANGLPLRIDARAFFRIGSTQGLLEALRIVMTHDAGIALRTELADIGRIGWISLDLINDAVISDVHAC